MKLYIKIFVSSLITTLFLLGLMIGSMQYTTSRNFADYLTSLDTEKLNDIIIVFQKEYEKHGGWKWLQKNRPGWHELLQLAMPDTAWENAERAGHQPPPDSRSLDQRRNLEATGPLPPPHEQPPPRDQFGIWPRLALLDAERNHVAGHFLAERDHIFKEIRQGNEVVGWLTLETLKRPSEPLDIQFLNQQLRAFLLIGGCELVLSALVALLLTRHLLAPVRQLIHGTRALTSLDFSTRIQVQTRDELGTLAEAFNHMAQTVERYEQIRKQWVSDISHELRTPLAILRGEIEALQDGVREINPQTLSSLHAEVMHLGKIVQDLHELALADSQALHFTMTPLDPIMVLREVVNQFQPQFADRQIQIDNLVDVNRHLVINADKERLIQLFSNIMQNSLHYADAPGTLTIREIVSAKQWEISFQDSGPGVPEEAIKRLFDRLFRVDPFRSREFHGSGLGLAICKYIVERHQGSIRAMNAPDAGLIIRIYLPLAQPPHPPGRDHAKTENSHRRG